VKIQFIFFNDENRLLLQPAAGKRCFPVGEVGFGFAVLRVNFMPRATLPALGETPVTFHLTERHSSNPCDNAR
jgi:membrane-associated PAP2 superfamily phosphatase